MDRITNEAIANSMSIYTLRFKKPHYESLYLAHRCDSNRLGWPAKIAIILFLCLYVYQFSALFSMAMSGHERSADLPRQILMPALLIIAIIMEVVARFCTCLTRTRGLYILLYVCSLLRIFSEEYEQSMDSSADCTAHVFMAIMGLLYSTTWIVPATVSITAMCVAIHFIHTEPNLPIDAIVTSYVMEALHHVMMAIFFYCAEIIDRYSELRGLESEKQHRRTVKLLKKLPSPLLIFPIASSPATGTAEPIFWNSAAEALLSNLPSQDREPTGSNMLALVRGIKDSAGNRTALDAVTDKVKSPSIEHKSAPEVSKWKYVLGSGETQLSYLLRVAKVKSAAGNGVVLMLQDETGHERAMKAEEKYQKLYVASVVHDIRTPLNGVMGILDIVRDRPLEPETKEMLQLARDTCTQLLFLTYDITDYSQLEAGKLRVNKNPLNVRDAVEDCVRLLQFHFGKKRLRLSAEVTAEVPRTVFSDQNRYMQLLLNYLSNALKFTLRGEVRIFVDYVSTTDILTTTVTDTGIGIRLGDFSRLFQVYGKLGNRVTELNPNGVGFGLSICKKLAEAMGGYVGVSSEYGSGSQFVFAIKANAKDVGAETPSPTLESRRWREQSPRPVPIRAGTVHQRLQLRPGSPRRRQRLQQAHSSGLHKVPRPDRRRGV